MQTAQPYVHNQAETTKKDRVASLIHLYCTASAAARREPHPRLRELRQVHAELIEHRLVMAAEELFGHPIADFGDAVLHWYRCVH